MHRNVRPHIAVQVEQDVVQALQTVESGGQIVVMLDLRSVATALQAQALHEMVGKLHPVHLGIGHVVGVEVARRAAEFGRIRDLIQQLELPLQPFHKHHKFLPDPRRRSGLAVRVGQHRYVTPLDTHAFQHKKHLPEQRLHLPLERVFERERDGGVVDVLRSQAEVDEFQVFT